MQNSFVRSIAGTAALLLAVGAVPGHAQEKSAISDDASLYFITPQDGATVQSPVTIRFGLTGAGVPLVNADNGRAGNATEAYEGAKGHITADYLKSQFKIDASVDYFDDESKIEAKGKGFTVSLQFHADEAHVASEFGFLLKAFKGTVLGKIESELKKHL